VGLSRKGSRGGFKVLQRYYHGKFVALCTSPGGDERGVKKMTDELLYEQGGGASATVSKDRKTTKKRSYNNQPSGRMQKNSGLKLPEVFGGLQGDLLRPANHGKLRPADDSSKQSWIRGIGGGVGRKGEAPRENIYKKTLPKGGAFSTHATNSEKGYINTTRRGGDR